MSRADAAPVRLAGLGAAHGRVPAVRDVSGVFAPGSLTAVVGPNGAGKTTLLRVIAGVHPPHAGGVDRGGLAPGDIALLPQASTLDRGFPIICGDVVGLGAWRRIGPWRAAGADTRARVSAALAQVGLTDVAGRPIGALSAGQVQRLLFARLIVQDAPVILLDEPFNAVDPATAADLLAIVRRWHAEGRTVVAVLHDLALAEAVFPLALVLDGGVIAWGPASEALAPENRRRARLEREAWWRGPVSAARAA